MEPHLKGVLILLFLFKHSPVTATQIIKWHFDIFSFDNQSIKTHHATAAILKGIAAVYLLAFYSFVSTLCVFQSRLISYKPTFYIHNPRAPPFGLLPNTEIQNTEEDMKTTYWVWKDLTCNGISPEWSNITGLEFLEIVRTMNPQSRFFITLASVNEDDGDGRIVIEATEAEYRKWRKEKRREQYLHTFTPDNVEMPQHDSNSAEDCADANCDVEAECFDRIEREYVVAAVARLSDEDKRLIEYLYLSEKRGTVRGYAALAGIPKSVVHRRIIEILATLHKMLTD
jgi:hypothetical protein